MNKDQLIERDLKKALKEAGLNPDAFDMAMAKIKRDTITVDEAHGTTSGTRKAVEAFRKEHAGLFPSDYRDSTKSLEQIERERDKRRFGTSTIDHPL